MRAMIHLRSFMRVFLTYVFLRLQDIVAGEELVYDYGDRRRSTVAELPWLLV